MKLTLFHYWRSSCSWRVRWAMAHKGIPCEFVAVDLLNGESESPEHLKRNPFGFVPVLEVTGAQSQPVLLTESLAIIEFLEETWPKQTLLPGDAFARAQIRALAEAINAGTQPLQNLAPQAMYSDDPEKKKEWARHWIRNGLAAYETLVGRTAGQFSVGDSLSLADLCLIPQVYNALRYDVALEEFPIIARINETALGTSSCLEAHPDRYKPQA